MTQDNLYDPATDNEIYPFPEYADEQDMYN